MKRLITATLACIIALGVAGCMMPKEFTARLSVKKDGGYEFAYDGSIAFLPMLSDMEAGKLDEAGEKKLAEDIVAELKKDKNVSDASYLGKSLFKLSYKATGNVNTQPLFGGGEEPMFSFAASPDGTKAVFQFLPGIDPDMLAAAFPASGLSPKGTIELSTELEVESSVGEPAKALLGNTYTWKVDGIEGDLPAMTLKLK